MKARCECCWRPGAAVDLKDSDGMTALMYASKKGCEAAVRVLLEAGGFKGRARQGRQDRKSVV